LTFTHPNARFPFEARRRYPPTLTEAVETRGGSTADVEEFRDPLLRYILSLGLRIDDGEEIVQEVFLALFQHMKAGKPETNLKGWIFRVGHNLSLKQRARGGRLDRVHSPAEAAENQLHPQMNPEEQFVESQHRKQLLAEVESFPEIDRCCLYLRAEGLRYREIAEVLSSSLGGVSPHRPLTRPAPRGNKMTPKKDAHISDPELLRAADGELSSAETSRIHSHLEACWKCRTRRMEFENTIADFVRAQRGSAESDLPAPEGPRAQLRARLQQLQSVERPSLMQSVRRVMFHPRSPVYAGIAFGAVLLVILVMHFSLQQVRAEWTPDASLTPGATRTVSRTDLCPVKPRKDFYPIPATLAYRVFEKYRIHNPGPRSYEVDYLISPALGGADDIRNLWPQPYSSGEWNAHVKDALEDYLHDQVCSGKLDLETAQRDIAGDWISAYQKYFHTDSPLPVHVAFSIDPPWED
jgi:RNA polymerase sigma factor (sigma-70 family)